MHCSIAIRRLSLSGTPRLVAVAAPGSPLVPEVLRDRCRSAPAQRQESTANCGFREGSRAERDHLPRTGAPTGVSHAQSSQFRMIQGSRPISSCQSWLPAPTDSTDRRALPIFGCFNPLPLVVLLNLCTELLLPHSRVLRRFAAELISWLRDRPSVFLIWPHKSATWVAPAAPH